MRTFQITEILPDLSVFENIRVGVETQAKLIRSPGSVASERAAVDAPRRRVDRHRPSQRQEPRAVGELAHGDQRVVEVAVALSLKPRLLLLDEPTAGMGDTETDHMVDLIRRLHQQQGMSILFIEHDMDIVFGIAERITVLDQGRVSRMERRM